LQPLRAVRVWLDGISACQFPLMLLAAAIVLNQEGNRLGDAEEVVAAHCHGSPGTDVASRRDQPAGVRPARISASHAHFVGLGANIR
jgi:hypothetical protein